MLLAIHKIRFVLALRLRQDTTMGLMWIAQGPGTGSWKRLSNLLNKEPRTSPQQQFKVNHNEINSNMLYWRTGFCDGGDAIKLS